MRHIKRVILVVNHEKSGSLEMAQDMGKFFNEQGIDVFPIDFKNNPRNDEVPEADLAVVLGGDGTVLYTAKLVADRNIPILGINLGHIGFLTEVLRDEWIEVFEKYSRDELGISRRSMVEVRVYRQGVRAATYLGLNEGVVSASGSSKILYFEVSLSGVVLGDYRADGMIVSTPTGSTAYSLAAGGPILHPDAKALILTPICPHSLSNRPVVIPGNEVASIQILPKQRTEVVLTIDGRDFFPLQPGDRVEFHTAKEEILLIRSDKRSFYEVVRTKLN